MKKYNIEVMDELATIIAAGARAKGISAEMFIAEILSRFVISGHILNNEETKKGYEETAQINLDWANL